MSDTFKTRLRNSAKIAAACGIAGLVLLTFVGTATAPPEAPLPPVQEHRYLAVAERQLEAVSHLSDRLGGLVDRLDTSKE